MRTARLLATSTVLAGSMLTLGPFVGIGHADYGGGATLDQWQVSFSFNCDNTSPGICVDSNGNPSLGGFWGWYAFSAQPGADTSGTGDGQVAGCGHTVGGPGGGAGHIGLDGIVWEEGSNGHFVFTDYTATLTGRGGTTLTSSQFPDFLGDSGVPMAPGHYAFHPAPGVSGMVNVSFRAGH